MATVALTAAPVDLWMLCSCWCIRRIRRTAKERSIRRECQGPSASLTGSTTINGKQTPFHPPPAAQIRARRRDGRSAGRSAQAPERSGTGGAVGGGLLLGDDLSNAPAAQTKLSCDVFRLLAGAPRGQKLPGPLLRQLLRIGGCCAHGEGSLPIGRHRQGAFEHATA